MKHLLIFLFALTVNINVFAQIPNCVLVIHGGAGTIEKSKMTPEMEKAYNSKLTEALQKGYDTLKKGGTSLSAVAEAIKILEDSPLFNAGKGSVLTSDFKIEMDASVMDGKTLMAGSVAGIRTIKNPITAAICVMQNSEHVMMIGKGAEQFARQCNLTIVDTSYFYEDNRIQQLKRMKKKEAGDTTGSIEHWEDRKMGTVGAVALDNSGNICSGTSTGGMMNKKFGRVGDAPIIGAGTYANNNTCGVSATGHGEYFIRLGVAKEISSLMQYKKMNVKAASEDVIMNQLTKLGGTGGVIALDAKGNAAMPFNTEGMFRGYVTKEGKIVVQMYK